MSELNKDERILSEKLRVLNIEQKTNFDIDKVDERFLSMVDNDPIFENENTRRSFAIICFSTYSDLIRMKLDPVKYFNEWDRRRHNKLLYGNEGGPPDDRP